MKMTEVHRFGSFELQPQLCVNNQLYFLWRLNGSLNVEEVQTKDLDHLEHLDLLATVAGVELSQVTPSKMFNLSLIAVGATAAMSVHSCTHCCSVSHIPPWWPPGGRKQRDSYKPGG